MSDAHTVSPLLDEFSLGKPFSSHNGITCCPAIHNVTKEKYILKRISIPESQDQVEAMLFTGACQDRPAAQVYYEESVHALENEIALLQALSKSRGFLPFTSFQTVAKENEEIGFDLYLLAPYRTTLGAYCRKNTMTHLGAVNLGIDLAAALSQSRRAGFLYLNLRPENICITEGRRFRLGDLGFMPLDDLAYATFPQKYRSVFTAPELFDDFSEISTTGDVYSLGMVLYHIYNGGPPFHTEENPQGSEQSRLSGQELPPPAYADSELAAIILKATAFHPTQRWQSPDEMGQALIAYMQKNPVNESVIGPPEPEPPAPEPEPDETPEDAPEQQEDREESVLEEPASQDPVSPRQEEAPQPSEASPEEPSEEARETPPQAPQPEAPPQQVPSQEETQSPEQPPSQEVPDKAPEETASPAAEELLSKELVQQIKEAPQAESASDDLFISLENDPEMSEILSRADSILNAKDPDPVYEDAEPEEEAPKAPSKFKSAWKKPLAWIGGVCVVLALVMSCIFFYRNFYCIPVEKMEIITGNQDAVAVAISTPAEEGSLKLNCQDTYGNVIVGTLQDGIASFVGLKPNTQYTITASVDGFHKLTGTTKLTYTTPNVTEIVSFTAVTGSEDGSVLVNFTVSGSNEPESWNLMYAIGEDAFQSQTVTGHSALLTGLTPGETYTLRLERSDGVPLTGSTSITHTVSNVITAQKLQVTERTENGFTLSWDGPETPVEQWTVHCSSDAGFDSTVTVNDTTATFTGLDLDTDYHIDVTAKGMSVSSHLTVTAGSAAVKDVKLDAGTPGKILLTWTSEGSYTGPWIVQCTYNGVTDSFETQEPGLTVNPALPGTDYTFLIQTADGSTAVGGEGHSVTTAAAPAFDGFGLKGEEMSVATFPAPQGEWGVEDLNSLPSKTDFTTGETIGFLVNGQGRDKSDETVDILVLLRDANQAVVSRTFHTSPWNDMWNQNLYLGQLPETPQAAGNYTLEIYFNGALVRSQAITIA